MRRIDMTNDASAATDAGLPSLRNLRLGTAPDSWGVWFPDDPKQVPWYRFLDEAAAAGYTAVELGPFGYLPTNPEQLRDELGRRGLTLTGATSGTALHRGDGRAVSGDVASDVHRPADRRAGRAGRADR
jgi:hypothetical protein